MINAVAQGTTRPCSTFHVGAMFHHTCLATIVLVSSVIAISVKSSENALSQPVRQEVAVVVAAVAVVAAAVAVEEVDSNHHQEHQSREANQRNASRTISKHRRLNAARAHRQVVEVVVQ